MSSCSKSTSTPSWVNSHQPTTATRWRLVLRASQIARNVASVSGARAAARQMAFELSGAASDARIMALAVLASQAARGQFWLPRIDLVRDELASLDGFRRRPVLQVVRRRHRRGERRHPLPVDAARAVPLTDVFERYGIALTRRGPSAVARCPFHDDRRPSLGVDIRKNVWFCQVCQIGGDGIRLVERLKGVGFAEAVQELAA